ncbi:type VI secretion system tube protein Hcp [Ochrobactrum sp. GPK 3]|uniref:type VI secretion system tube protein Hcp n=1 Tax=Brucella sp. 22210 TaxID=3453892 RepID=UPI003138601C
MLALLDIPNLDGKSGVAGYEKAFKLDTVNFGAGRSIRLNGTARESSPPFVSEIIATRTGTASSIEFFKSIVTSSSTEKMVLNCIKSGEGNVMTKLYSFALEDAVITHYNFCLSGDSIQETLGINFLKIGWTSIDLDSKLKSVSPQTVGFSVLSKVSS